MAIEIGQDAPEFELKDQVGESVRLADLRSDRAVALVFFPFAFSGICTDELCALRDDFSQFAAAGVQVVAVSCDSRHALRKWAEETGYDFPMLADFWPHGEVARAYGVFNEAVGCANRATFLIDRDGTVVDTFATPDLGTARELGRYSEAIAKLAS
jgi:peroxiredoxin